MIDKKYFQVNLAIYYTDFLVTLSLFIIAYLTCLQTEWPLRFIPFLLSVMLLYRAAAFIHELTHQSRNEKFKRFYWLWNLTAGLFTLVPGPRFFKPHLTHHQLGIFRTPVDPQYPLLRKQPSYAFLIVFVVPFIMPILSLLQVFTSSFKYMGIEERIEHYLVAKGQHTGGVLPEEYREEVFQLGRYYLLGFLLYAWFLWDTLPLAYGVQTGAWMLTTMRIPLEHGFWRYKDSSDEVDQILDSFTVENPFSMIWSPLGLRYHTAHHMYPGVPYHNLYALHQELKQTHPYYSNSIVSLYSAIRGPSPDADSTDRQVAG